MKKLNLFAVLMLFMASLTFVSCGDDDDDYSTDDIIGTWSVLKVDLTAEMDGVIDDDDSTHETYEMGQFNLTFNADGTCTSNIGSEKYEWSISGNKIIIDGVEATIELKSNNCTVRVDIVETYAGHTFKTYGTVELKR